MTLPTVQPEGPQSVTDGTRLEATMSCPVCGVASPHSHDAVEVGRAIADGADIRAIPVAVRDWRIPDAEKMAGLLHRYAMQLFREGLDRRDQWGDQQYRAGLSVHALADALPWLIEVAARSDSPASPQAKSGVEPTMAMAYGRKLVCGKHPDGCRHLEGHAGECVPASPQPDKLSTALCECGHPRSDHADILKGETECCHNWGGPNHADCCGCGAFEPAASPQDERPGETPCNGIFESGTGRVLRRCNKRVGHAGDCGPKPDDQQNAGADELPTSSDPASDGRLDSGEALAAKTDNGVGVTSAGGESGLPHRSVPPFTARVEQETPEIIELVRYILLSEAQHRELRNAGPPALGHENCQSCAERKVQDEKDAPALRAFADSLPQLSALLSERDRLTEEKRGTEVRAASIVARYRREKEDAEAKAERAEWKIEALGAAKVYSNDAWWRIVGVAREFNTLTEALQALYELEHPPLASPPESPT